MSLRHVRGVQVPGRGPPGDGRGEEVGADGEQPDDAAHLGGDKRSHEHEPEADERDRRPAVDPGRVVATPVLGFDADLEAEAE